MDGFGFVRVVCGAYVRIEYCYKELYRTTRTTCVDRSIFCGVSEPDAIGIAHQRRRVPPENLPRRALPLGDA
jgi:hypothetical protein